MQRDLTIQRRVQKDGKCRPETITEIRGAPAYRGFARSLGNSPLPHVHTISLRSRSPISPPCREDS
jgi:hypothetical protein